MSQRLYLLLALTCATPSLFAQPATKAPPQEASKPADTFTGKITGNRVRLRIGPDLDSKIVKELNKDDLFVISSEENGFYAVNPPKGMKGYVFRSYILDNVVEANKVNVRLEPNTDAPIVGQLNSGEHVEGNISSQNSKWLEIDLPKNTHFYVAKEYVQNIGRAELLETMLKRKADVQNALNDALALSQNEMRKPFDQINIDLITTNFKNIIQNYPDFPEQSAKAKDVLALIQETYLKNKVAYLETKTQQSSAEYQARLNELENRLKQEQTSVTEETALNEKAQEPFVAPTPNTQLYQNCWEVAEDTIYGFWCKTRPGKSKSDFYQEGLATSVQLRGVIEPYNQNVKNRPGDYILKVNNVPVAFLYSTCINLSEKVGKTVTLTALKRPNNYFAYPAYYVISLQ